MRRPNSARSWLTPLSGSCSRPSGHSASCLPACRWYPITQMSRRGPTSSPLYRASFLLPHRRSAWLRFAERLEELAHFATGLQPPGGEDVTATVSGALSRTASNLMGHVEAV